MSIQAKEQKNQNVLTVKIAADITELEQAIDRCTAKTKELMRLTEQADKLLCKEVRN